MGLTVSIDSSREFEPVLELIQPGVLADIVDKGEVPNKFKPGTTQRKCYFVWIVAEEDSEGRNKRVFESFTVSLNEKASLRKRLKDLGYKEFDGPFDLDSLIGTQRMLVLSSEDGDDGRTFVKVTATMPLKKGQAGVTIPSDFTRKEPAVAAKPAARPPAKPAKPYAGAKVVDEGLSYITDDDIPF